LNTIVSSGVAGNGECWRNDCNIEFINLNDLDSASQYEGGNKFVTRDDHRGPRRSRMQEYKKAASVGKKTKLDKGLGLGFKSRANSPAKLYNDNTSVNTNFYYQRINKYNEAKNGKSFGVLTNSGGNNYEKKPNDIFYNPLQKPFVFTGDNRINETRGIKREYGGSKNTTDWLNSTMPNSLIFEKCDPPPNTYRGEKNILMKNWLGHVSSTDLWSNNG
jgi:hypothetical protein